MRTIVSMTGGLILRVAAIGIPCASVAAQEVTRDPDQVRLEVQDIRRLAQVVRRLGAGAATDTAAVIERDYLARASPGLRAYAERYHVTGDSIAAAMAARPAQFADLDALADTILGRQGELEAAFRRLQALHPGAAFPPVWFLVGGHGTRGLARPEGVLVAAEGLVGRPDDLAPLVLHELAHFQQAMVQGIEVYRRIYGPDGTLLALALREGSADLVAELTTGRHTNPAAERYGLTREAELWARFQREMHRREPGDWMFVRPSDPERPPDLGYWIGYRIARRYYERAADERQAIRDILALTDFGAFLAASGYAGRVGQ